MTYNGCDCTLRGMFYERMVSLAQMGMVQARAMGNIVVPVHEDEDLEPEEQAADEQAQAQQG